MSPFSPEHFFDLTQFPHSALFEQVSFVWDALEKLFPYMRSLSARSSLDKVSQSAHLVDPEHIFVGEGVVIEAGAYVRGPCLFGPETVIRHGAYIRGFVLTGKGCVIGHATEVKNAIFLNEAKAAHFAYVGDSILGSKVNLGAGTKCANLRFDGKEIFASSPSGEKIQTGRQKLGAIFGDGAQTGCNAVTNPGTFVLPGITLPPLANRKGWCDKSHPC